MNPRIAKLDELRLETRRVMTRDTRIVASLLFGSRARGEEHAKSDWDIALVACDDSQPPSERDQICDRFQDAVPGTHVVIVDTSELEDARESASGIQASILREGQLLEGNWERPELASRNLKVTWADVRSGWQAYSEELEKVLTTDPRFVSGHCTVACARLAGAVVMATGRFPKRSRDPRMVLDQIETEAACRGGAAGTDLRRIEKLLRVVVSNRCSTPERMAGFIEAEFACFAHWAKKTGGRKIAVPLLEQIERESDDSGCGDTTTARAERATTLLDTLASDPRAMPRPTLRELGYDRRWRDAMRAALHLSDPQRTGAPDARHVRNLAKVAARYDTEVFATKGGRRMAPVLSELSDTGLLAPGTLRDIHERIEHELAKPPAGMLIVRDRGRGDFMHL